MIFAAQGFWWFINLITGLYRATDPHAQFDQVTYKHESRILVTATIIVFLASLGFLEYSRYFKKWGSDPGLNDAFTQRYVDIADYLNHSLSRSSRSKASGTSGTDIPRYILVNEGDVMVDGVPNNAQTIKFLTQTHSYECSEINKIYYLTTEQLNQYAFPDHYVLIPLLTNKNLEKLFTERYYLNKKTYDSFMVF